MKEFYNVTSAVSELRIMNQDNRPESAKQFDEIYMEHHDPEAKEERKILKNRRKRAEEIKKELGYEI